MTPLRHFITVGAIAAMLIAIRSVFVWVRAIREERYEATWDDQRHAEKLIARRRARERRLVVTFLLAVGTSTLAACGAIAALDVWGLL